MDTSALFSRRVNAIALAEPPFPRIKTFEFSILILSFCSAFSAPIPSVLYPLIFPFSLQSVLIDPIFSASGSISSINFRASILNGIVILAPLILSARKALRASIILSGANAR